MPQLAVTVALAFVLASVTVFLGYIHHIAQSIRAATIVNRIGDDTRRVIERRFPTDAHYREPMPLPSGTPARVLVERQGVVQRTDDDELLRLATEHDITIAVRRAAGEFVPAGAVLLEVYGEDVPEHERLRAPLHLGRERSLDEDVGFGLRQLVDIAERALSPGINDPTTAVQVLDQLHDLLRWLATRPLPPRQSTTDAGRLAVDVPQPAFADYLGLGVDEIAHWGSDSRRIQRRLAVMLADLSAAARPEHRDAVTRLHAEYGTACRGVGDIDALSASDIALR